MAFAVLGMAVPGMAIAGEGCVGKSFPAFWETMEGLYRNSQPRPGGGRGDADGQDFGPRRRTGRDAQGKDGLT